MGSSGDVGRGDDGHSDGEARADEGGEDGAGGGGGRAAGPDGGGDRGGHGDEHEHGRGGLRHDAWPLIRLRVRTTVSRGTCCPWAARTRDKIISLSLSGSRPAWTASLAVSVMVGEPVRMGRTTSFDLLSSTARTVSGVTVMSCPARCSAICSSVAFGSDAARA